MPDTITGLAGVTLDPAAFSLGRGIEVTRTYAHMMAHFMIAYSPAPPGKHHPAPWSAVDGGAHMYDWDCLPFHDTSLS